MKLARRSALLAGLTAPIAAKAQTPPPGATELPGPPGIAEPAETIDLWPRGAPGRPATLPIEKIVNRSADALLGDRAVSGVSKPRLAVFRPRIANGASIMILPGGGYVRMTVDKEGYELARWFAARGFTAFVLFYRLPGDGWKAGPNTALSDAQRGMRLIRARAIKDGLDPDRVAVLGFSAGGHLCADLATRFAAPTYAPVDAADRLSARPKVAAPIYPVRSDATAQPFAHGIARGACSSRVASSGRRGSSWPPARMQSHRS